MPLYRVHFAATPAEPFPPLDMLPTIEIAEPTNEAIVAALHGMLGGFVSSNRELRWARIVVSTHPDGKPKHVIRAPIQAAGEYDVEELN